MSENKVIRLIIAATVGAVMLLVILLSIMVYQMVAIDTKQKDLAALNAKINEYKLLIEQGEDTIEVRSTYQWIEREARKLGYMFDGDKIFPAE